MVTKIYANAVAKYNEGKLLDSEKLRRLADAEFSDAVKMLCDYGYGGGAIDEKNYDVDEFISHEISSLIDYVFNSSPNEYLSRVLINRFLYGNAKVYYKSRFSDKFDNRVAIYEFDDGEVKSGIEKGEYVCLPKFMAEALVKLDSEFENGAPNPKIIDIELTKAQFADSAYCAKKSGYRALRSYVAGETDLSNIISALRAKALNMSENAFNDIFIDGGYLSRDEACEIFRSDDPAKIIGETRYGFLCDGNEELELKRIEARTDDFLLEIWRAHSENMLSVAPFVNYFLSQLAEYKTVKMILVCLKNNAKSEILPRLRVAGL